MKISQNHLSPTHIVLTISLDKKDLEAYKRQALAKLSTSIKVPGFRAGKAPDSVVEKHVDSASLQSEVVDMAINHSFMHSVSENKLRPVQNPKVSLKKFVPFTELEFDAEIDVIADISVYDYKKIKKQQPSVKVADTEVKKVLDDIRERAAERIDVSRPAKKGDQVVIDFKGLDAKGQLVPGAESKDYPLILGSDMFIPGFEDNVIGLKVGDKKEFTLTFPKDYGVKALANKKVTFQVSVKKVQEVKKAKLDNEFAAKVGPFKDLAALKKDILNQLQIEREKQAKQQLENDVIQEIVQKSKADLPQSLIDEQVERLKREVQQNVAYRGQTWKEALELEGLTEEEFIKQKLLPEAETRVKTGLVLSEIADQEEIKVTPEELDLRLQLLKGQYTDAAMQAELEKPEARQDIASRLLTEKTVDKIMKAVIKTKSAS